LARESALAKKLIIQDASTAPSVEQLFRREASTQSRADQCALLAMNSSSRKPVQDVEKLFQRV